ncbi:hypothetical protein GCM10027589_23420 [Actinocorallia lasiicapitis]
MAFAWRGRLIALGTGVATVAGGVATNRVEGPWWVQVLWFSGAVGSLLAAGWLRYAASRTLPPAGGTGGASVVVSGTGKATSGSGGSANTGLRGWAGSLPDQVAVERTGVAEASDGGNANTGVQLD